MTTRIEGDLAVTGQISANTLTPSDGTVTNAKVSSAVGDEIDADKIEHVHRYFTDFDDEFDGTPAGSVEKIVYRARAAGVVRAFGCLLSDTGTSTDVDFDLSKAVAGSTTFSTLLSADVNITHADTDNTAKLGTLISTVLAAGDVLRLDMAVTTATGALGPVAWVEVDELPS